MLKLGGLILKNYKEENRQNLIATGMIKAPEQLSRAYILYQMNDRLWLADCLNKPMRIFVAQPIRKVNSDIEQPSDKSNHTELIVS